MHGWCHVRPLLNSASRGAIAQLEEHLHGMQGVRGSSPRSSTNRDETPKPHPSPARRGVIRLRGPDVTETTETSDPTEARTRIERYDPTAIEPRWQARWAELELYETDLVDDSRPKYYLLTMYPYPSGDLHIGHWYIVTPSDALARFRRMHGYNVFFPIGFDAFGLPAENAAIKSGGHPFNWTMQNIEQHAPPVPDDGRDLRLEARGRHRPIPAYYMLEPVAVPALARGRPGLPRACRRSTGAPTTARSPASRSRAPTATAGAVARWSRSATSSSGSCARPRTPTSCSISRASTGPSPIRIHADQLDRPVRGRRDRLRGRARRPRDRRRPPARLHDPARHAVRGDVHGPRARASARRAADRTRPAGRGRRVRRAGPPADRDRAPVDRPREDRRATRRRRDQPGQRRAHPDLDRRLRPGRLRHRRDHGRARPRRARLRVRHAGSGCRSAASWPRRTSIAAVPLESAYIAHAAGEVLVNSDRYSTGCRPTRAARRSSPGWRRPAAPSPRSPTGCATGWSAASATGARRSRSSTARTTASSRSRTRTCRSGCPRRSTTRAAATIRSTTTRPS